MEDGINYLPQERQSTSEQQGFSTYSELFDKVCPYYMSIGVTYNQFWNGDFAICKYARQSEKLKAKKKNEEMWWNAIYIYRALIDSSPAFHDFGDGKKIELKFSVEQPFPLTKEDAEEHERLERERKQDEFLARMTALVSEHNRALKEKVNEEKQEVEE